MLDRDVTEQVLTAVQSGSDSDVMGKCLMDGCDAVLVCEAESDIIIDDGRIKITLL